MEQAAQPPEREKFKSFDLMASVDMMRFDMERFGRVLPETRMRVYDEELTSISEGIDRASRTEFTFSRQDENLVLFESGTWRPYIGMLTTGLETARLERDVDPRRQFLLDWAARDLEIGYKMQALKPGERIAWCNPYPIDIEEKYGREFMQSCGLKPNRQMGFLYLAICNRDGSVTLQTQSVDRSDEEAFSAAMDVATYDENQDMDALIRTYDGALSKKRGGKFYAGRRHSEIGENAWAEITKHGDLIGFFLDELENLAASNLPRRELERTTKRHIIGIWKAFKNRLDGNGPALSMPETADEFLAYNPSLVRTRLAAEARRSYYQAWSEGDIKVACGGALKPDEDPLDFVDGAETFKSIFGDKSSEDYKFDKHMFCVVCQAPPEKGETKKMCGPCGICKGCDNKLKAKSKGAFALAA